MPYVKIFPYPPFIYTLRQLMISVLAPCRRYRLIFIFIFPVPVFMYMRWIRGISRLLGKPCPVLICLSAKCLYGATNYPDAKILKIERDKKDYEVKLSNRTELKFDLKFNLIDIDF